MKCRLCKKDLTRQARALGKERVREIHELSHLRDAYRDAVRAAQEMLDAYAPKAEETAREHGEYHLHSAVQRAREVVRLSKTAEAGIWEDNDA